MNTDAIRKVAEEMRATIHHAPPTELDILRWADALDAAVKGDVCAWTWKAGHYETACSGPTVNARGDFCHFCGRPCVWTPVGDGCYHPSCLGKKILTEWRWSWVKSQSWRFCPHCGGRVRVRGGGK